MQWSGKQVVAYLNNAANGDGAEVVVCPVGYKYPKLKDIECGKLGDAVSGEMSSLGGILLHEFTHWRHLSGQAVHGVEILDANNGYGPVKDYSYGYTYIPFATETLSWTRNRNSAMRDELLDGPLGDLVDVSSRAPVDPSSCTGFVHNPAPANRASTFNGAWFSAALPLLSGYIQSFALDGWRVLAERYPACLEGPTTWTKRFGLVSVLAIGLVWVWRRAEGRRGGYQA